MTEYVYRIRIAGHNSDGTDLYFGAYRSEARMMAPTVAPGAMRDDDAVGIYPLYAKGTAQPRARYLLALARSKRPRWVRQSRV